MLEEWIATANILILCHNQRRFHRLFSFDAESNRSYEIGAHFEQIIKKIAQHLFFMILLRL